MEPFIKEDYEKAYAQLKKLPYDLMVRIDWGLYGERFQFFISGVDGTLAQLGKKLPDDLNKLRQWVTNADVDHKKLLKEKGI